MDITPRHIEQIEALSRYGSFRRAAEKLFISQPALSRSILTLEEKLGVKFFDRTRGGLAPTEYGRIVLDRGKSILNDLQLLHRDIAMLQGGEKGILTVGCGPFPAEVLAGEAIARFNTLYPKVVVKLVVDHSPRLTTLLQERSLDFFVAEIGLIQGMHELDFVHLPQQQGYFCSRKGHPLVGRSTITMNDILEYPLALMWVPERYLNILGKYADKEIDSIESFENGFIRCDNLNTLLCVVRGSDAVTVTTREVFTRNAYQNDLTFLPLLMPEFRTHYAIVSLAGYSTTPAISYLQQLFVDTARQAVQPI